MFSTGINNFLQSINNEVFMWVVQFTDLLTANAFFMIAIFIIIFSIDLKKGFIAVHLFFWTIIITQFLKTTFDLPRPLDVDSSLKILDNDPNKIDLTLNNQNGNVNLNNDIIKQSRTQMIESPGFPSQAMSILTIFWMCLYRLFNKSWLLIIGGSIIGLTAISKMYLGLSFLGDILGGIALGLIVYLIAFYLLISKKTVYDFVRKKRHGFIRSGRAIGRIIYLFLFPLILFAFPEIDKNIIAKFMGLNLAFYITGLTYWPVSEASIIKRIFRVILALSVFLVLNLFSSQVIEDDGSIMYFTVNLIEMFLTIQLSIWLCKHTGLFIRKSE